MTNRETFTRAITSSVTWGIAGKMIGILKHAVIAGAIGLSAQLDSFYAATSILAVFVFLMAGMFDVLGVPKLIELNNRGDLNSFNRLARSLFTSSLVVGVLSFAFIVTFRENLTFLAIGFEPARRNILIDGLLYIAPLALVFSPLRQLAAIHRAQGHFSIYYQTEFIVTLTWFLAIVFFRDVNMVLFFAWPIGVAAGLMFIIIRSPFILALIGNPLVPEAREVLVKAPALALLQGLFALHIAVDHFFASYLPVGSLGSLSLAMVIITALVGVLRLDTSYIAVFGQEMHAGERNRSANKLIGFSLLMGIPYLITLVFMGDVIVRILFERGVFSSSDRGQTSLVLAAYGPAVLAMILLPPIEAIYQVTGKMVFILLRAVFGLLLNVIFCYVFLFIYNLGNFGIALATTISMSGTLIFGLLGLKHIKINVDWRCHLKSSGIVLVTSFTIALFFRSITQDLSGFFFNIVIFSAYCCTLLLAILFLPVGEAGIIRSRLRTKLASLIKQCS